MVWKWKNRNHWRSAGATILLVCIGLLIGACGQVQEEADHPVRPTIDSADKMVPIIAASELEVGQNRLPIGVLKDGSPINDPDLTLRLRLFHLDGEDRNEVQGEADAVYRGEGLPWALYVAHPQIDKAGTWGVEIEIPQDEGPPQVNRIRVEVLEEPQTPPLGSKAIPSQNLTIDDVPNLEQLTSDFDPEPDFYQMTIAEALAKEKPLAVMFATPGYCMTAVCAPNMTLMKQLHEEFTDQIIFLHVEVYPYPFDEAFAEIRFVEAMQEWNLTTEPWIFLIDRDGIIQAKYEGGLTLAEMRPALQHLLDGKPITADIADMGAPTAGTDVDTDNEVASDDDEDAPAPTPAVPGEVVSEVGGFACVLPAGWDILVNSGAAGNGVVMLGPPGVDIASPHQMIMLNAGPLTQVARGADPDAPLEELLDAALAGGDYVTLSEREEVMIGGIEGHAADMTTTRTDVGEVRGRIIIARLDDERLFQVSGFAPEDEWDIARFESLVETIRFFETGESGS